MSKYTFEEVQEVIKELRCISLQGTCDIEAEMLTEYAERIKADEGAALKCTAFLDGLALDASDAGTLAYIRDRFSVPAKPAECANGCPAQQVCDYCQPSKGKDAPPPAQPTRLEDAVPGWHSVANPPDGKTDLWSRDVIGLTNGREVMRVAYFRGKDSGVWQRPNGLVVTGERIVAWCDLPELSKIEHMITAAMQESGEWTKGVG